MVKFIEPVEPDENGDYTCPVCGEYTGKMESVAAHISGKSDDQHKGRTGRDYQSPDENGEVRLYNEPWDREEAVPVKDLGDKMEASTGDNTGDDEESSDGDVDGTVAEQVSEKGTTLGLVFGAVILYWIVRNTGNETQTEPVSWQDW